MAWTLYRIVKDSELTLRDFMSLEAQGAPPRSDDPEILRLRTGISCWATEAQARRTARRYPHLGSYIARIEIPEDAPVRVERTLGRGHYTVWGEPSVLMTYAVAVTIA
jgi:hypothetical protein